MKDTAKASKYRSRTIANRVIGLSVSYQRENLLARGLGLEHVREMLLRMGRLILRHGASLAYGGNWNKTDDNFTYDLLELVKEEQEDVNPNSADSPFAIGRLYNHSAWPHYLGITSTTEAQWINCCRIIRVSQKDAGFAPAEIVPDSEAKSESPRSLFNAAVTLSAMRRLMMRESTIHLPDLSYTETIPAVVARVILGGKSEGYSGFMPGIFEEALATFEVGRPLYLLGGFGGATEILAKAILAKPGSPRPDELTLAWHEKTNPGYAQFLASARKFKLPKTVPTAGKAFDLLWKHIQQARSNPHEKLATGLDPATTRELLMTRDMNLVVRRVSEGLIRQDKLLARL